MTMWLMFCEQNDELYEEKKLFLEEAGLPSTKAFPLYNDRCVCRAITTHHTDVVSVSFLFVFFTSLYCVCDCVLEVSLLLSSSTRRRFWRG